VKKKTRFGIALKRVITAEKNARKSSGNAAKFMRALSDNEHASLAVAMIHTDGLWRLAATVMMGMSPMSCGSAVEGGGPTGLTPTTRCDLQDGDSREPLG